MLIQPPCQVFLNIVLDDAVEEKAGGEKVRIGMVVIRGNSVVMLEVRCLLSTLVGRAGWVRAGLVKEKGEGGFWDIGIFANEISFLF